MGTKRNAFITKLREDRAALAELLVIAVVVSLAVNLLAGQLLRVLDFKITLTAAAVLFIVASIYMWITRFGRFKTSLDYSGFLIFDSESKAIMPVREYWLAEQVAGYLESAFVENEALRIQWETEPLAQPSKLPLNWTSGSVSVMKSLPSDENKAEPRSFNVIRELLEYIALSHLSTHLSDYFNNAKLDESKLVRLGRNQIPEILLSNRFLELFSRSISERSLFLKGKDHGKDDPHSVVTSIRLIGSKARFQHFELILPPKAYIKRVANGGFTIDSPMMKLTIQCKFSRVNTVLPHQFLEQYLGRSWIEKENDDMKFALAIFPIEYVVDFKSKWRGLLSRRSWDYQLWAESFSDSLEKKVSQENFFTRINWDAVSATLYCLNRAKKNDADHPTVAQSNVRVAPSTTGDELPTGEST